MMSVPEGRRRARCLHAVALLVALLAALLPVGLPPASAVQLPPAKDERASRSEFAPLQLLVRFRASASEDERDQVRAEYSLRPVRDLPVHDLELVEITNGAAPPERAAQVNSEQAVRYAEPNFVWEPAAVIPDDPEFSELWGLDNTGQTGGTSDADIDAPEGWEVTSGTEDVVVGVIDTGVKIDHPDLAANIWTNEDEIAANGIDDDSNGYVDDVHGWDFFNDDNSVFDELDGDDHGTHVSGTIAGVWDNSEDVAGVSQAQIMPLKFIGPPGGSTSDAILALDYAIDNGADLTNNSWGGGSASTALQDKIAEADAAGQLFVAAAGNDGDDTDSSPHYPSSYPNANIVSVAATTHTDGLASFSNFGDVTVDLGAPGDDILSTVPRFGKAILVGPDTPAGENYRAALHTIGLEGVSATSDRQALLSAALSWTGAGSTDPILLVDDDEGASFQGAYQGALTALGFTNVTTTTVPTNGSCSTKRIGPSAATMASYDTVIWFTGADFDCTLNSSDRSSLTTYLTSNNGNLLLFGVDIGYDLTNDGAATSSFLTDVLYADYIADSDLNLRPSGVSGTPYASVPILELQEGTSGSGQTFSSALGPRAGAIAGLRGAPTTWFGGTSMATPHVSGAAAQVIASYPGIDYLAVKSRLMNNGDMVASLAGKTVSGRRLNLAGALDTAGAPSLTSVSASPNPFSPDGDGTDETTTLSWTQNEPSDVTIEVIPDGGSTPVRTEVLGALPEGSHDWVWDGEDDDGGVVADGSYEIEIAATDAARPTNTSSVSTVVEVDLVAASSCLKTGSSLDVNVVSGDAVTIAHGATDFSVTALSGSILDATCGGATLSNIDTVHVSGDAGSESAAVNMLGGTFAPGATAEGTGASEIEFVVEDTIESLAMLGGTGGDKIRLGTGGYNLNNDDDGDDITFGTMTGHSISGNSGNDVISAAGGIGTGSPFGEAVTITGGAGADTLIGGTLGDDLTGGDGADILRGAAGGDSIDGGAGLDTGDYTGSDAGVTVDLTASLALGGHAAGDSFSLIERLTGSSFGDSLTGNASANTLKGSGGADVISGGEGKDTISGGGGADFLDGGGGIDVLTYAGERGAVTINLLTGAASGGNAAGDSITGFESVTGSSGGDNLTGNDGANTIRGGPGGDSLSGLGGNDVLIGGTGVDTFDGGNDTDNCDNVTGESATSCEL